MSDTFKALMDSGVSEETTQDLADLAWGQPVLMAVLTRFAIQLKDRPGEPMELLALALCAQSATHGRQMAQATRLLTDAESRRPLIITGVPGLSKKHTKSTAETGGGNAE